MPSNASKTVLIALVALLAPGPTRAKTGDDPGGSAQVSATAPAPELAPEAAGKVAHARPVNPGAPHLDGVLDDECWSHAEPFSDFTQDEPDEGRNPTQRTEVRVLYDDEALYVAVAAEDTEPARIEARLSRRDGDESSDVVWLLLDSRHDHQSAYCFGINPAGVKSDLFLYDDGGSQDDSWDPVWDGAARLHAGGWSAECRIPFSQLRFNEAEEQRWGLNVQRQIRRLNETDMWVYVPRATSGFVSRFGLLDGLRGVQPRRSLEIMPYVTGRGTFRAEGDPLRSEGRDLDRGAGVDLKAGLGSAATLDATVNPDFGQVEADPSVLNLSEFETFFPEKRPFFIEGADLFATPIQLYFSRRIGRAPGRYDAPESDEELERPVATTILAAAKITGRTDGGISYGVVEAVTDREYARTEEVLQDDDGNETGRVRRDRLVEPRSNYLVGRVRRDVLAGNSHVGALVAGRHIQGEPPSMAGGLDWNLNLSRNFWRLSGQVAQARAGGTGEREQGSAAEVNFEKQGGKWTRFSLGGHYYSPGFEINETGFLRRNNKRGGYGWFQVGNREPWKFIRRSGHNLNAWASENCDGWRIERGWNYNNWFTLLNYWGLGFGANFNDWSYSDTILRGGPPVRIEGYRNGWVWLESDGRRRFVWSGELSAGRSLEPGIWWRGISTTLRFKPSSSVSLQLGTRYNQTQDTWQWVENVEDEEGRTHYVFGEVRTDVLDLTLRSDITFSRDVSLQLYAQPFVAVGDFSNPVELVAPPGNQRVPYDYALDDFSRKALNSNVVLRWEYRPGSTLFMVWNRRAENDAHPGDFHAGRDMADLLGAPGTDVVMMKVSYWFNP